MIDRNVRLDCKSESECLTNDDFANILLNKTTAKDFFTYLENKFNGDLFCIEDQEYESIDEKALTILRHLISGSRIQDNYIQKNLFNIYDFSIIPVEFISNVYELFIGEKKQAEKGAYYTPVFLVDYILSQTVEKYFKHNPKEYNCKILDPACGSGIFLVEAYRKIIKQYETLNPKVKDDPEKYKNAIIKLAKDNLFGIDKDPDAVSVAAFSIYLTMLHYQSPPDIENFRFPPLTKANFFTGDFFDQKFEQKDELKNIDLIIGNPPWKRGQGAEKNPLYLQYISKRKKEEKSEIEISNKEIAQAFLLRTSDFCDKNTQSALIVTSKALYNLNGKKFRKYLSDNYFIDRVFELAAVRREVFDNSNDPAIAPAAIIFYRYAHNQNTDKNTIEHIALKPSRFFSMFKVFSIQRNDYKRVTQKRVKDYDYLWKILVYGSYLDFNFIKRLKEGYKSIADIIYDEEKFLVKQGLKRKDGKKKIDVSELTGWDFLDTSKKELQAFFIRPNHETWDKKYVGYIYRKNSEIVKIIYEPPALLIKDGLSSKFMASSAISKEKILFTDSITSIKALHDDNVLKLNEIMGLINSFLYSYWALQTASFVGIERERTHDKEKFSFPFIENRKIVEIVTEIEQLKQTFYKENKKILSPEINKLQENIDTTLQELDGEVLKSFDLSDEESAIVDYAVNTTIPMIMRHKGYEEKIFSSIKSNSVILKQYAQIFFDRFAKTFDKIGIRLSVQVWHNNNIIGMFFKETPEPGYLKETFTLKKDLTTDDFLYRISSIGIKKITDRLFIQKDIRGFEEEGFYIIKPNEKRLWHKAIAYLDMYDFADAMLRSGREESDV